MGFLASGKGAGDSHSFLSRHGWLKICGAVGRGWWCRVCACVWGRGGGVEEGVERGTKGTRGLEV